MYGDIVELSAAAPESPLDMASGGPPGEVDPVMGVSEDQVVFGNLPLDDPLPLVECHKCGRRIKLEGFARHAEICTTVQSTTNGPVKKPRNMPTAARGLPKGGCLFSPAVGSSGSRGSGGEPPRPHADFNSLGGVSRAWLERRRTRLERLALGSSAVSTIPIGVDPRKIAAPVDEPSQIAAILYNRRGSVQRRDGKAKSRTIRKSSKEKKRRDKKKRKNSGDAKKPSGSKSKKGSAATKSRKRARSASVDSSAEDGRSLNLKISIPRSSSGKSGANSKSPSLLAIIKGSPPGRNKSGGRS